MEVQELQTTSEDTLYDILLEGAKAFSEGKPKKIEYVSVVTTTNFGQQDPNRIMMFGTFGKRGPRTVSVDVEYPSSHEIPDEALLQMFAHFPRKQFKIYVNQSIEGWSMDRILSDRPVMLTITSPIGWGFVESSLPKKANWIDASMLTGILKELGIRYSQDESLIIKSFKYKSTSYDAIISACEFFKNHKFKTELTLGSDGTEIKIKQDGNTQNIEYRIFAVSGVKKRKADNLQEVFEKYLTFTASGRNYEIRKDLSELKEKGMKIDYQ